MPIFEYVCGQCGKISSFLVRDTSKHEAPVCPHCKSKKTSRVLSRFAALGGKGGKKAEDAGESASVAPGATPPDMGGEMGGGPEAGGPMPDMAEMERMMSSVDENDPRSMGRMMRKLAEQTGEPIDGEMEEVVRRLESGEDPEKIEEKMGGAPGEENGGDGGGGGGGGDDLYDG